MSAGIGSWRASVLQRDRKSDVTKPVSPKCARHCDQGNPRRQAAGASEQILGMSRNCLEGDEGRWICCKQPFLALLKEDQIFGDFYRPVKSAKQESKTVSANVTSIHNIVQRDLMWFFWKADKSSEHRVPCSCSSCYCQFTDMLPHLPHLP